jgi:hypothetical protein
MVRFFPTHAEHSDGGQSHPLFNTPSVSRPLQERYREKICTRYLGGVLNHGCNIQVSRMLRMQSPAFDCMRSGFEHTKMLRAEKGGLPSFACNPTAPNSTESSEARQFG